MNCANCKYNDGLVYTSNPVQYKCTVTWEYHHGGYECDVEFAPVRRGKWIMDGCIEKCNLCGEPRRFLHWVVCPGCGAVMEESDVSC